MGGEVNDELWLLYFDGDNVGAEIELHLLNGELDLARTVSASVVKAIASLTESVTTTLGGTVIFAAGDEVLIEALRQPTGEELERFRAAFRNVSGLTVSCGVGKSPAEVTQNLRFAKLRGKDQAWGRGPR
jgi:minimal CRISPR polymerase domain